MLSKNPPEGITQQLSWCIDWIKQLIGRSFSSSGGTGTTPTLDQVLTAGNTTTQGFKIGSASSTPTYDSVYLGPNTGQLDSSGQLRLRDVPDGFNIEHNRIGLAASSGANSCIIGLSSGNQTTQTVDSITLTTSVSGGVATNLPTVKLLSSQADSLTLFPKSIVLKDTTTSAANTCTITNNVLTSSRTINIPDTTGIIGVARYARFTGLTAAGSGIGNQTVGAVDSSYVVSANVLITSSTTYSFTVVCNYTDEGNTARQAAFSFSNVAGTISTLIVNTGGAVPYMGLPLHIRCKAGTSLSVQSLNGTFTNVIYNIEAQFVQIG